MLDGTTPRPFFPRMPGGAIQPLPPLGDAAGGDEAMEPEGAALAVALRDEDEDDDGEEGAGGEGGEAQDGAVRPLIMHGFVVFSPGRPPGQ